VNSGLPSVGEHDPESLFPSYELIPNTFDEMMDSASGPRPHWQRFISGVREMSEDDLNSCLRKAERMLRESGFAHALAASAEAPERPWDLDFVPLVIPAEEWLHLEAGLVQRACLLNAVLADLYGPQRLLKEGHLPAALIFANPHFLRPCHGIEPRDGIYLHTYAADLGRGPDGRWWVLSDRTQAPAGAGYALENRLIMSRCMPEFFRQSHIHRLAVFFQTMHNGLMARTGRDDPRIVLLTDETNVDSYFDHAYLARYLGYTLAAGADLTVRQNKVYLKTVEGLMPVDLIVRGIDSELCDPLDLDTQSTLGVAGLVQAARARTVTVANALGSGLVESKALMGFLPTLCRVLLDEDLILPNTATWWCGQDDALGQVLYDLDRVAIDLAFERRPLFGSASGPVLGSRLTDRQRQELVQRLKTRGHDFVAQEMVSLSTTPIWHEGTLQPRPMSTRVFLAAAEDGYTAMPGGLTRVSATNNPKAVLLRRGEGAKDTWVLSPLPTSGFSLLRSSLGTSNPRRRSKDIPSHSADNLFWLGRYAERTEDMMRALRSVLRRLTEELTEPQEVAVLQRIVDVLLHKTDIGPATQEELRAGSTVSIERQINSLMFVPEVQYGFQTTVTDLNRTAALSRDWLSLEAWRALSRVHLEATRPLLSGRFDVGETLERTEEVIQALATFSGMETENMTRDYGWRFLNMGRRLERGRHLSRILRGLLVQDDPEEDGSLLLLLELADSIMTYRWRYLATPMMAPVIDLLLLDETNPRSVAFQLAALLNHVENLPPVVSPPARSAEQRIMLSLSTAVRLAEIPELCQANADGYRAALATLLDQLVADLPRLSEAITEDYFSHAQARRPVDLKPTPVAS
jgi:uncharacterized circularly permuted ATP-grasp superfamily protein/uncharacterized alpha-E superfamily protein